MSTDAEWEEWGRRDPYYGVITDPRFRRTALTEEARREFFASGEKHAAHVLTMIRTYVDGGFEPRSILDFGCGVGRLLPAFGRVAPAVTGADVSPSMLAEARRNCDAQGAAHVALVATTDDELTALTGTFDLVHSFIVLQHVPAERGRVILAALLERLRPGGVGAIHVSYSKRWYAPTHGVAPPPEPPAPAPLPAATPGRAAVPGRAAAAPAEPPAPPRDPEMLMIPYHMNEVLFRLQESGVHHLHVELTDHGGELGALLYFQKHAAG